MSTVIARMIIRSNLRSPDLVINASDPLEASLNNLLAQITDPSSLYFIESKYLFFRLFDCAQRALQTSFQPGNCPLIFDSWSCWNSTPPGQDMHETCPSLVNLGFRPDRLAEKHCREDGTWWVHPDTNRWVGDVVVGKDDDNEYSGLGLTTPVVLIMKRSPSIQQ